MLTEDEMRRIEAEELAALDAARTRTASARRRLAEAAYRQEVRAALRPRPFWWPARWALVLLPAALLGVWATLRPAALPDADDPAGGIGTAALLTRCEQEVAAHLEPTVPRFPSRQDAARQVSASADGKRWDGWAEAGAEHWDFSCTFSPAEGTLHAQLFPEALP
ncbi:hypothetical protein [Deinococcus hohokamensis]|uniref:Uncharacterized protein n=1 Tax=Deinococcus hohokamensis TaxID=309883 RepID=A0ABV9IC82_9DEIO